MSNQQNIALVKKLLDEVWNKNNIEALNQYLTSDIKLFDPAIPNFKGGLTAFKERQNEFKKAFPNRNFKILDIFATEDNRVIAYWSMQGTHKGDLQDLPATGKSLTNITGITVYTLTGDKVSEIHQSWDRLGMLEQLGVIEQRHLAALHQ